MIVTVADEQGNVLFSYDTHKRAECVFPGRDEVERVADAVEEALMFLPPRRVRALRPENGILKYLLSRASTGIRPNRVG